MKIIIKKTSQKIVVSSKLRDYIEEKIRKYESLVSEPATCEAMLTDLRGIKDGKDKVIKIVLTVPNVKNPLHIEVVSTDYFSAIDLAQERLEQQLKKYKTRKKIGSRFPLKYWAANMVQRIRKISRKK